VPLLPQLDAPWYEARLGQPGFAQAPTFEGRPAEAGAVALTAAHPATAAQLERGGTTTLARLLAKLVHVRVLLARVASLLGEAQHPASPPEAVALPPGVGVGLAETSRGRLVHRVELSAGAVTRWAALAPTEWTFHPRGAVAQALLGAPVLDLRARAARLLAACDACVPCAVHLEERADA
jgi:Ni,Fe-hydrogenase I large subunit